MKRPASRIGILAALLAMALALPATAQDLASFEQRITEKTLDNGLHVIVCERPVAPVFSFYIHVDAGGAQERPGITGMAHMFEHMAFKGTSEIGTTDFEQEKVALAEVESTYATYNALRLDPFSDETETEAAREAWLAAREKANAFVKTNEFTEIIDRNGGVGLNAFTSWDETGYFYSLPSNRLELWAYLESSRFVDPVFREFYKERDVVMEERRMRTESNPFGRLLEQFLSTAYMAHPYGQPVVGWPSDLKSFSATDARDFFEKHYVPANLTVVVVGDVTADEVLPLVERYFGRLPAGEKPEPLRTEEIPQIAEKVVTLYETSQPVYIEGYHRPDSNHADSAVYDAIADILSNGRVSRMYRSLVRDKKIAAAAAGLTGFPGQKYPGLFVFFGIPTPEHGNDEIAGAIHEEIEKLKAEEVTDAELQMVKTRAKADLIRGLGSNQGLAMQLGQAHIRHGDWRELFRQVDKIEKVTKADIVRVAQETFTRSNRTVARIENADGGEK